ncbi:carbon monoxide dehydrogenase [Streptomyces sp. ISL-98]|uniref:SRPBCC domain-containing protein n=1 Tax=Streptomyces sp. ISL-98 TaxID=2819192 RepID=UPI001BE7907B|nr:SRPBCC domain-containing protein [Streptomyces sp. ISL-98]MBT2507546.1 carbon monoxide dehydrogenase [Streptomyces sp. ISL-98]
MEHEVFVPVPAEALRQTLGDPARVARCVPGLQQDADTASGPLSGRLKLRVGGHTITYRGTLRVTARPDGRFDVEGEGTEARGTGAVKLALTVGLAEGDDGGGGGRGTTVTYAGTASGEGRIAEQDAETTLAAAHRLLDRFTARLVDEAGREAVAEADADAAAEAESEGGPEEAAPASPAEPRESVFDTEVPPPGLDAMADVPGVPAPSEPPAEAAHARRTMIGRSAEEVDHAPPRGRYAPVPAPQATSTSATLRWIAPAAAIALASAVVVGRVLRRRR